ncbi:hypothetical protein BB560_005864 [Smittium megazygosporum]|uniref:Mediator of RNA polymerase II transcription subunit 22 n=1 Tax=Smittium megazygosporum TaxID=133381 RepID=A0A2T9YSX3_9FUNG|nr:hypothetical protein BB560_005864 [Smittium megazygosporum]
MIQKSKNTIESAEPSLHWSFKQNQLHKGEAEFNSKIASEIENMVSSMKTIIELCQIKEKNKFQVFQEGYQIHSKVATLVKCAETLLSIISNLKKAYLVNDFKTQLDTISERDKKIKQLCLKSKVAIKNLSKQFEEAISELNSAYLL